MVISLEQLDQLCLNWTSPSHAAPNTNVPANSATTLPPASIHVWQTTSCVICRRRLRKWRGERWGNSPDPLTASSKHRGPYRASLHRHRHSPAQYPLLLCLTSCAHFWSFPPVTVSRHDKEKPFPTRVPLASVGWAEVWSLAQGGTLIILVCKIILCNTYLVCWPLGVIHSGSRGEEQGFIA